MNQHTLSYKPAYTIRGATTVLEALKVMAEKDSNSLCVVDASGHLEGIITIQDIAGATVPNEFKENVQISEALYKESFLKEICDTLKHKPVSTIMRQQVMEISPDTNIMTVMADFLHNDLYNVPITKDGRLVGVITRSDLRKALIEAMQ